MSIRDRQARNLVLGTVKRDPLARLQIEASHGEIRSRFRSFPIVLAAPSTKEPLAIGRQHAAMERRIGALLGVTETTEVCGEARRESPRLAVGPLGIFHVDLTIFVERNSADAATRSMKLNAGC